MSMNDYFYDSILKDESLVLYPYDDGVNDTLLIEGYRLGARAIINELKNKSSFESGEDALIYPLLNIYTNIIEFSLKKTIVCLKQHFEWGCDFLVESQIENKIMRKHDLQPLYDEIKYILQKKPNPHFFENEKLDCIIKQFDSVGIESFSSRYHKDNKQNIYRLYKDQLNVRVIKLHNDIEDVTNRFIAYWDNMNSICPYD